MRLITFVLLGLFSTSLWATDCAEVRKHYQCEDNIKYPIHLTFDDGPADLTPKVLDILKRENIPATFFIIAHKVDCDSYRKQCANNGIDRQSCTDYQLCQQRKKTLKRIVAEGHMVGSHSYRHDKHSQIPASLMHQYIQRSKQVLAPYLSTQPPMFRLPYGDGWFNRDSQPQVLKAVKKYGFKHIAWEMSAYDWRVSDQQGDKILDTVMHEICTKKKGLILFHDGDSEQDHIGRTFTNTHIGGWIPKMRCVADFKPLSYFYPDLKITTHK